jgi:hypothetical protein
VVTGLKALDDELFKSMEVCLLFRDPFADPEVHGMPESGFTTITSGPEMRSAEQVKVIHLDMKESWYW